MFGKKIVISGKRRQIEEERLQDCTEVLPNKTGNSGTDGRARTKRTRAVFTPDQLKLLETEFASQQYMSREKRISVAFSINLSDSQVKVWFQNRRVKWRKQQLQLAQQKFNIICWTHCLGIDANPVYCGQ